MSADNYTVCPRCAKVQQGEIAKAEANLEKAYGKVTAVAYQLAAAALEQLKAEAMPQNLREDYELGINRDGTFDCSYSCSCSACKWRWEFKARRANTASLIQRAA